MKAIVLAAGASRRAAGCKALFAIEGQSYVERTVTRLRAAGAADVVVVVALPWRDAISARVDPELARTVENLEPERGMLGSLCIGLSALALAGEPVVVSLVDHPEVAASTIDALACASRSLGPDVTVRPRFSGRHGHPIALGASVARALRETTLSRRETLREDAPSRRETLREDAPSRRETLRDALVRAGRLVSIDVADPAILQDLDQPPRPTPSP